MAAPSLGYAIGLNVKRKDIFGPAANQLSENLSLWSAKKERAAKEKKAEEDKFFDQILEAYKIPMNVRVQGDYDKSINQLRTDFNTAVNSGDMTGFRDKLVNFYNTQTGLKQRSGQNDDIAEMISTDQYAVGGAAKKYVGTDDDFTPEDERAMSLFGIYLDPNTGTLIPGQVSKYTPSQTFLDNRDISSDELLAAQLQEQNLATQRQKDLDLYIKQKTDEFKTTNGKKPTKDELATIKADAEKQVPASEALVKGETYKTKKISGYDASAYNINTPTKALYSTIVDEILTSPEAIDSALMEWEKRNTKGLIQRIDEIKADYKAKNQNEPELTDEQAAQRLAKEHYMSNDLFNSWQKKNAKAIELNRTPKTSGGVRDGGSKTGEVEGVRDITYQAHWSTAGFAKLNTGWIGNLEELYNKKKAGTLGGGPASTYIGGYGPTVEFAGGTSSEVYSIAGLGNINPVSLYYDIDTGKFRLSYNTTITSSGITVPAEQKDAALTKEQLNQVRGALATNMQKKIAAFDAALAIDGFPTTLGASGGGAPAGSTGGSTGTTKIEGF